MYEIDRNVTLASLDLPPSSSKAPCPIVLSDESVLVVAYYLEMQGGKRSEFGGVAPRGPVPIAKAAWAVVEFESARAVLMGPGCESAAPHPLSAKGLERYGAYEVSSSRWIRTVDGGGDRGEALRHFVLSFHDSTFECVAKGYKVSFHEGPLRRVLGFMQLKLIS